MDNINSDDIKQMNELLARTGDFMDYFENAESKMLEWRQEIVSQADAQKEHLHLIQHEMESLKELFVKTGIEQFNQAAEETMEQGNDYLESMKNTEHELLRQIHDHRAEITRITQHAISEVTRSSSKTLGTLEDRLSHYNIENFEKVAHKSCKQVEKTSKSMILRGNKILKFLKWRTVTLSLATTLITAFIVSLYIDDEYPWEMHRKVVNERNAGKILLHSWPKLSYGEREKILQRTT